MKRYLPLTALALICASLTACQKSAEQAEPAAEPASTAIATVDGKPVTSEMLEAFSKASARKGASELTPEQRKDALDQLIQLQLTADAAVKSGLDKQPDTAARLELARLNVLAEAALTNHLKGKEPTEQELRAEYETQVAAMPRLEYRARHILVATEAFAQAIIDKLNKGGDFAAIARKESMDSQASSGELGWFSPTRMVPEFAAAVTSLKKGEITAKPVQTKYGWHVIQLEDTRDMTPPDFEDVKARLSQLVQNKKMQAYIDELKKTAKIEEKT